MDQMVLWVLYDFVIFGSIGMVIGSRKGRVMAGLLWSMLLGPIGWLLVGFGPNLKVGDAIAKPCPHCRQLIARTVAECPHCAGRVVWINGTPRQSMIVQ